MCPSGEIWPGVSKGVSTPVTWGSPWKRARVVAISWRVAGSVTGPDVLKTTSAVSPARAGNLAARRSCTCWDGEWPAPNLSCQWAPTDWETPVTTMSRAIHASRTTRRRSWHQRASRPSAVEEAASEPVRGVEFISDEF